MKVLQVLCGGAWGGGSVVALTIVRAMIARGDQVWVVCNDDENAAHFGVAGAKIVRAPCWFRPINPLDAVPFAYLVGLCLTQRFDLVATHTSKGGFLGRLAARLAGVPHIVHHAHGFFFNFQKQSAKRRFYIALEQLAARAGDMIISVSEEHRQGAIRADVAAPERITTVLNGIDLRPLLNAHGGSVRRRLGFRPGDILVGATGRLATDKGFVYLIRAMPSVLASFPSAYLVIIGDGPLEAELRDETVRLCIADHIRFLGFRRDVPELLAALDVFVQPSLREGLSISLIEALAAGKPIVASSIPSNGEVIAHEKSGLLAPPADPAALAQALKRLLRDPAFAQALGENAQQDAKVRFSKERMVEEVLARYDRVSAAGHPSACRESV